MSRMKSSASKIPWVSKACETDEYTEECPPSPLSYFDLSDAIFSKKKTPYKAKRKKALPKYVKYKDLLERDETKLTPRQLMMVMRKKGIITDGIKELDKETKAFFPGVIPDRKPRKNLAEEVQIHTNTQPSLERKTAGLCLNDETEPQDKKKPKISLNAAEAKSEQISHALEKPFSSKQHEHTQKNKTETELVFLNGGKKLHNFKLGPADTKKRLARNTYKDNRQHKKSADQAGKKTVKRTSRMFIKMKIIDKKAAMEGKNKRKSIKIRIKLRKEDKQAQEDVSNTSANLCLQNTTKVPTQMPEEQADCMKGREKKKKNISTGETACNIKLNVEKIQNVLDKPSALCTQAQNTNIYKLENVLYNSSVQNKSKLWAPLLLKNLLKKDKYNGLLVDILHEINQHTCFVRILLESISKRLTAVINNPIENGHMHTQDAYTRAVLSFKNIVQNRENCCLNNK